MPLEQKFPGQAHLDFRGSFQFFKSISGLFEQVDSTRALDIPGPAGALPARWYLPGKEKAYPLFVLLHGSGWVHGFLSLARLIQRANKYFE